MAKTTALQKLYNIAAGYKEKTGDKEEINVGNVDEKVIGAIGSGSGGYGLFSDEQDAGFPVYPDPSASSGEIHD